MNKIIISIILTLCAVSQGIWARDLSKVTDKYIATDGLILTGSTSHTIDIADGANVGTAKVTVTFKGDYASIGSVEKEFPIVFDPSDWADNGDGSYTIGSTTGWNVFCDMLENSNKGIFEGKTVKLGADISVSRMAGASSHDFTGTFDGNGKTLTVNYTADAEYAAPSATWSSVA